MKAYQVIENGKPLEERILETPEPNGREVVLKTVACGVCHSDVHIHDGYFDLGGGVQLPSPLPGGEPLTMGHEIFGEVSAIGDEVEGINIGERYVAYPWMGCGDCDLCNDDMTHYCANNSNLGIHVAGGYGEGADAVCAVRCKDDEAVGRGRCAEKLVVAADGSREGDACEGAIRRVVRAHAGGVGRCAPGCIAVHAAGALCRGTTGHSVWVHHMATSSSTAREAG